MSNTESAFNRADTLTVDIVAEHPENVVCEGTIVITLPDPNLSGIIRSESAAQ